MGEVSFGLPWCMLVRDSALRTLLRMRSCVIYGLQPAARVVLLRGGWL